MRAGHRDTGREADQTDRSESVERVHQASFSGPLEGQADREEHGDGGDFEQEIVGGCRGNTVWHRGG